MTHLLPYSSRTIHSVLSSSFNMHTQRRYIQSSLSMYQFELLMEFNFVNASDNINLSSLSHVRRVEFIIFSYPTSFYESKEPTYLIFERDRQIQASDDVECF